MIADRQLLSRYESDRRRKRLLGHQSSNRVDPLSDGTGQAQKLVDGYFDEVFKLIFDGNGELLYPSRLKFLSSDGTARTQNRS